MLAWLGASHLNPGPGREKLKSRMQWSEEALGESGPSVLGNAFYHQRADGSFEEISDRIGAENYLRDCYACAFNSEWTSEL